ncbi:MAG: universal stress protein [Candidatus Bathyarchaeota archaeon]|jgi:nucleotide-binding universal stress UspA family protein|nr:universal stress protein [Candidatus Bathyarchaeota archaeon]
MFDPVFSKVLVAYDGSDPSKRALDHAAKMAAMFEGELVIVTVVPKVSVPIYSNAELGAQAMDIASLQERMHENYSQSIKKAEEEIKSLYPHLKVETILKEGRPSSTIVSEADRLGVSLIVMGSRGLGGISGWILGSTSRQVVDQCTKAILIVK